MLSVDLNNLDQNEFYNSAGKKSDYNFLKENASQAVLTSKNTHQHSL